MPGVAIHGSEIYETIVRNLLYYDIYVPDGIGGWIYDETKQIDAKITGSVIASSSKMKIFSENVATVGDSTFETWEVYPRLPSGSDFDIRNVRPYINFSGQGRIISGSTRGKLDGKPIALIGSTVETCLGTITTIKTGSDKMKFSS